MTRSRAIALMLAMFALVVGPGLWDIAHGLGHHTPSSPLEQQWPEAGQ